MSSSHTAKYEVLTLFSLRLILKFQFYCVLLFFFLSSFRSPVRFVSFVMFITFTWNSVLKHCLIWSWKCLIVCYAHTHTHPYMCSRSIVEVAGNADSVHENRTCAWQTVQFLWCDDSKIPSVRHHRDDCMCVSRYREWQCSCANWWGYFVHIW